MIRMILLSLFVSTGAFACGPSPLLHHTNAPGVAGDSELVGKPDTRNAIDVNFIKVALRGVGNWKQGPQNGAESILEFRFVHPKTGDALDPQGDLQAELWMPDMGHGSSPVEIERSATEPGVFMIKKMYFIMNGTWQLRLRLIRAGQVVDDTVANVTL
jgi:hypothetical protein